MNEHIMRSNILPELSQQGFSAISPLEEKSKTTNRLSKYSLTPADRNSTEAQRARAKAEKVARSTKHKAPISTKTTTNNNHNFTSTISGIHQTMSSSARTVQSTHRNIPTNHFSQTVSSHTLRQLDWGTEQQQQQQDEQDEQQLHLEEEHQELPEREVSSYINDKSKIMQRNHHSHSEYSLNPSNSAVAAEKAHVAERWRSDLLHCETDLRELVARGNGQPPSLRRIMSVVSLFDKVTDVSVNYSSILHEMLQLFRSEFCHAIFCDMNVDDCLYEHDRPERGNMQNFNMHGEDVGAYFDQVHMLLRENVHLQEEVDMGNTRETMVELRKKLKECEETITMYESEVHRLSRQTDNAVEQYCRTRDELYEVKAHAEQEQDKADRAIQALNVENKDLQLQLFRLRKQVAGGKAKLLHDSYSQLKLSKMDMMTTLFSEGDERVSLLVMMSQLESRLNEILDSYDNEFILTFNSTIVIDSNNNNGNHVNALKNTVINGDDNEFEQVEEGDETDNISNRNELGVGKSDIVGDHRRIKGDNNHKNDRSNTKEEFPHRLSKVNTLTQRINISVTETNKSYASHLELRRQMGISVSVILEEMLYCSQNYRRLVPRCTDDNEQSEKNDETDGFVAVLFDERIYHKLLTREVLRKRMEETEFIAKSSPFNTELNVSNDILEHGDDNSNRSNSGEKSFDHDAQGESIDANKSSQLKKINNKNNSVGSNTNNKKEESTLESTYNITSPHSNKNKVATDKAETSIVKLSESVNAGVNNISSSSNYKNESTSLSASCVQQTSREVGELSTSNALKRENELIEEVKAKARAAWRSSFDVRDNTLEEIVKRRREEWLRNTFRVHNDTAKLPVQIITNQYNTDRAQQTPHRLTCTIVNASEQTISCTEMLPRLLSNPLKDLCGDKFGSGVDVYVGNDPLQQRYLCTVNYIDPASSIAMPEPVNYIKLKNKNMMRTMREYVTQTSGGSARASGQSLQPSSNTNEGTVNSVNDESHRRRARRATAVGGETGMSEVKRNATGEELHNMISNNNNKNSKSNASMQGAIVQSLSEWGGSSPYVAERVMERSNRWNELSSEEQQQQQEEEIIWSLEHDGQDAEHPFKTLPCNGERRLRQNMTVFDMHKNLRIFHELSESSLWNEMSSMQQRAGATSSTTAMTVALQRLNPLSPNRNPEWSLYKSLFGGYRSLTPRMLEVTTIDHILLGACERYFRRMEFRYGQCRVHARQRGGNYQMLNSIAERLFREEYELSDFQEGLVDELESRYGFPELVAKTMYEMLCYLDAMASRDSLLRLYLSVIRGFVPATYIHYICYTLYHLSFSWPASNSVEEVARDDVMTVLGHMYRNTDRIVHVDVREVMKDFDLATRGATLSLITMREYISTIMLHHEEPVLLYFHGLITSHCGVGNASEISFESYLQVISKLWPSANEPRSLVRYMVSGLGLNRTALQSAKDLSFVAASSWCSNLWM